MECFSPGLLSIYFRSIIFFMINWNIITKYIYFIIIAFMCQQLRLVSCSISLLCCSLCGWKGERLTDPGAHSSEQGLCSDDNIIPLWILPGATATVRTVTQILIAPEKAGKKDLFPSNVPCALAGAYLFTRRGGLCWVPRCWRRDRSMGYLVSQSGGIWYPLPSSWPSHPCSLGNNR